jgi:HEAT repeat protein
MVDPSRLQQYLDFVCKGCQAWWKPYAKFIEEIDDTTWLEFELKVKKVKSKRSEETDKQKNQPRSVLTALNEYGNVPILIIGSPGAGKSTLLAKVLFDSASCALQDPTAPIPVLIELKSYGESGIWGLIQATLEVYDLYIDVAEIKQLVAKKKLLLLADGVNELPEEKARLELTTFCRKQIPVIFTTRDLGGDLGIEEKLEIQPLRSDDVATFLRDRLPRHDQKRVQELCDRARDFGQTPLMVWMLYSVFQGTDEIPTTRGEAYRAFTIFYAERAKEGIPLEESRSLLAKLAFEMMHSEKPTELRLAISEIDAQRLVGSEKTLNHLLKYHLLERQGHPGNRRIRFCHQALQEYYAAEALLQKLTDISDYILKRDYLNYLKWTEAIALMLGLLEAESQAEKLVKLALGIDLKLSARLAGEANPELQTKTISIIVEQKVSEWFRIFLLGETKSPKAVHELMKIIEHSDPAIRRRTVWALRHLSSEFAMPVINKAIEDSDFHVRETAIRTSAELNVEKAVSVAAQILSREPVASVREVAVVCVLGKSDSEAAVLALLQAIQDTDNNVRVISASKLKNISHNILFPLLAKILKNKNIDPNIRKNAAKQLGELGDKSIIFDLFEAQLDLNSNIYKEASHALQKVRNKLNKKDSDLETYTEEYQRQKINYWLVYLKSGEPIPRGNAILELTNLLDKEVAVHLARQALDDPHHYVRGHAIARLVKLIGKEAIPQAIRALDDLHYHVREQASQVLVDLKPDLPDALEIPKDTISNLIQTLSEEKDEEIRRKTITTLTNLCHVLPSLLLNKNLEEVFLNASHGSDSFLCSTVAISLGSFSSERVVSRLLQMIKDSDSNVALAATEALKNMPLKLTACHLPVLIALILNSEESFALDAILAIQEQSKFYNYKIAQAAVEEGRWALGIGGEEGRGLHNKLDAIHQEIKVMSETPRNSFDGATFNAPVNFAPNHGHQPTTNISTQHNYASSSELDAALKDLNKSLDELQRRHPNITTETQAYEIIDAEFTTPTTSKAGKLATLRKQLLNPERHLQASKATFAEVAKHYLEESVWAKAFITYIDAMSTDPKQGA